MKGIVYVARETSMCDPVIPSKTSRIWLVKDHSWKAMLTIHSPDKDQNPNRKFLE